MNNKKRGWKVVMTDTAHAYSPVDKIDQTYHCIPELTFSNEQSLNYTINQLQTENERLKDKIRLLEQRVFFDGLTGLSRRELCLDVLDKLLADPTIQHVSVVFLDLDNLKTINDKLGHDAGDQAICFFSNMLKRHGSQETFVARYGGDEFVVLLPGEDRPQAAIWCDTLANKIGETSCVIAGGSECAIYFSAGVYTFSRSTCNDENAPKITASQLIQFADHSMYQIKRNKKFSSRVMKSMTINVYEK
jgi:diguanylate cyclase (GGDEF)-like protein